MGFLDQFIINVTDFVRTGFKTKVNELIKKAIIYDVYKSGNNTITFQKYDSVINIPINGTTGSGAVVGTIGPAEDGDYTDGLFTDFTESTLIGVPIDRFNEVLKALAPSPAPSLDNIDISALANGKLSFGSTRNDISYENVTTDAGNSSVDFNGSYLASGTRVGITNTNVSGVLNEDVAVDSGTPTPSYPANAFGDANLGELKLYMWDGASFTLRDTLDLSSTSGAITSTYMSVSSQSYNKFPNGNDFTNFIYRTGTFTITTGEFNTGFNAMRIDHVIGVSTTTTNYLEWVYDSEATALSGGSGSMSATMSGSKYISGVRYYTGGTGTYLVVISNAYRNVYYISSDGITFPSKTNLSGPGTMNITDDFANTTIVASSQSALPALPDQLNAHLTDLTIDATFTISATNLYPSSSISSNISIKHPLKSTYTGSVGTETDFLMNNTTDSNTNELHNFTGEGKRLEDRDYSVLAYADINGGTYDWDSSQSLVGASAEHNTGLLLFDNILMYPKNSILNSTYGFTTAGNFNGVTNGYGSQVDYSSATGTRTYLGFFKSNNTTTQSTLTFEIDHTGNASNFLTNGGTGGSPSGNNIKIEFLIVRTSDVKHGWANPFASSGNPEGIAVLGSPSHVSGVTTVQCTLSTTPRVGNGDLVIVRVKASSGWTNYINSIEITNI